MRFLLDMLLPKAERLRADQINEAEKFYLYHQAQAERHAVLAAMYKSQTTRLIGEIESVKVDLPPNKPAQAPATPLRSLPPARPPEPRL